MEGLELQTVVVVSSLVLAGIALPITAIALHQRRRRAHERSAGLRRKEKIRL
jgi:NhaP-type Na+/H+ or K+/H+ antiporter